MKEVITISKTLSVCMISKNEEANIERCLKSVQCIADEIILADTGSTDNTVEIAKSLGAKVVNHKWNNDFSAARNASLKEATKDWILFLDCDEEMTEEEALKFKALLQQNDSHEAFYLRLVNIISDTVVSDAIVLRAFKNRPEYRFKGKMHEQVITVIQEMYGIDSIGETPIQILHYGYDPNIVDTSKKSRRNLDILLSYDEKDKDGYYYYVLGNEYARIDDFETALMHYDNSLKRTNAKMFRYIYYPYLAMNIIKTLYVQKRYYETLKYIEDFKETLSDFKDMYFMETLCHIDNSRISKARSSLEKYLYCPRGSYEYPSNNYENFHDLTQLMYDLNKGAVEHEENLLSVWIPMDEPNPNIVDCIKSVNEVAHEVIIITNNYNNIPVEDIRNAGGKVLNIAKNNAGKNFQMAMKMTRGDNVLVMYPDEIMSHVTQIQLANLLKDGDMGEAFYLRVLDMKTNEYTLRFTLFKTNKKINSIEEYQKYLENKKIPINDVEILIHKKSE